MRTTTKHKQKASQRRWPDSFQRVKHKITRSRRPIQQATASIAELPSNRFLTISFENIPYLSVFKQGKVGAKELVELARNRASSLVREIEGPPDYKTLTRISAKLDEVAKEAEFEWFVGETGGLPAIIFYHDLGALGGWIPIRVNFLSKLRRRSKKWHETVLNSFQHMSKNLLFDDATRVHYALDMIEEQIEEWDDDDENGYGRNRQRFRNLVESYQSGKIRHEMDLVLQEPQLSIDECLIRLDKLPSDLIKLKVALADVLDLAKTGKSLVNFDLKYGSGIREVEQFDDYYISIDRQFNWVYDYDVVCDELESHLDADYSGGGEQPLTVWRILGNEFKRPKSRKEFIRELEELKRDPFPVEFDQRCGHLCRTINELFPSKSQR